MCRERVIVLKLGGSILRDDLDFGRAVSEIARWRNAGYAVIGVVSALAGETERLIARARLLGGETADESATAALVATGEQASASMLVLALARAGIGATVLDSAAIDLRTAGEALDAAPVAVDPTRIRAALGAGRTVIVPGFVGRDDHGNATLLGRGGSDLTALFLAARLNARCRLVKDVDGLYQSDPALTDRGARRYATLDWAAALLLAGGDRGSGVVQGKGVRLAWRHRLEFEVAALGRDDATRIGDLPVTFRTEPDPSCTAKSRPDWIADAKTANSAP